MSSDIKQYLDNLQEVLNLFNDFNKVVDFALNIDKISNKEQIEKSLKAMSAIKSYQEKLEAGEFALYGIGSEDLKNTFEKMLKLAEVSASITEC